MSKLQKTKPMCKVFSATMARDRETLGEKVTNWLNDNPYFELTEKATTQSSDNEYHCITITLWGEVPA